MIVIDNLGKLNLSSLLYKYRFFIDVLILDENGYLYLGSMPLKMVLQETCYQYLRNCHYMFPTVDSQSYLKLDRRP